MTFYTLKILLSPSLPQYIDAREIWRNLGHVHLRIEKVDGRSAEAVIVEPEPGAEDGAPATAAAVPLPRHNSPGLNVPLPVTTAVLWSISFLVTLGVAFTRARLRLQFREFMQQCNFSLTLVDNNVLQLRTLKECTLDAVLPDNKAAVDIILRAARNTTSEMPLLSLPAREYDLIMTQVLNKISEMFAPAFFAQERCVQQ